MNSPRIVASFRLLTALMLSATTFMGFVLLRAFTTTIGL